MLDHLYTAEVTKEHLLEARHASLRHVAFSSEAVALRDHLLPHLHAARQRREGVKPRRPTSQAAESQQLTLDALLAGLILASGHLEALGFCFRQAKRTEFTGDQTKATSRAYEWQLKALHQLGLADVYMGFTKYDDFEGARITEFRKATRIRATPSLLVKAGEYGITHNTLYQHYTLERSSLHRPVIVRAGKAGTDRGKIISYPRTPQARAIENQVERINTIYTQHRFDNIPEPQIFRGFNMGDSPSFSFNKGGRLYGAFQQMSRESRRAIRINGHPIIELDLKAAHLTILHHITGTQMHPGDPYAFDDLPRPLVKAAVTAMIGKGQAQLTMWTRTMRDRIAKETGDLTLRDSEVLRFRYPVKMVSERVIDRHPALLFLTPGELDWADLQYLESRVLIETIIPLGDMHNIPALPLHDSIIVPEKDEEVSRWYLQNAFEKVTGGAASIERK